MSREPSMTSVPSTLWGRARAAAVDVLPRGGALPEASWRGRHRGITTLLWAHAIALPLVGVLRGLPFGHALLEAALVAMFAFGACLGRLSLTVRSSLATLGLVSSSAILVHFFDGLIEMHFHFFVMVAVVALYQAWRPYLLALGFVVLQHTVVGVLAPQAVYDHVGAQTNPWRWALIHGAFILAESVTCLVYWRVSEDALDRERDARSGLETAHQDLARAQALSSVGSWDWDLTSNQVTWSDHMYVLAGVDSEVFQPSVASFLKLVHPDDRERVEGLIAGAVDAEAGLDYEARLVLADGVIRVIHALGELKIAEHGQLVLFGTVHDVTEWKLLQGEIERLAFHDPLTGLANRRLFMDSLEHALAVHRRSGQACAVLFMDLDDFKNVNDDLGHSAGDEVLRVVAMRLEAGVRTVDTVARIGGDEFAILLEHADLETATRLAERLETQLRQPIQLHGAERSIGCSIGIATTEEGISADDILRNADAAMYAVKIGGKNSHNAFPSTLSGSAEAPGHQPW